MRIIFEGEDGIMGSLRWDGSKMHFSKVFDKKLRKILQDEIRDQRIMADGIWLGQRLSLRDGDLFLAALPHIYRGPIVVAAYDPKSMSKELYKELMFDVRRRKRPENEKPSSPFPRSRQKE